MLKSNSEPARLRRPTKLPRMVLTAVPAGAVTFSLFLIMQSLIAVDAVHATDLPTYTITPYITPVQDAEPEVVDRHLDRPVVITPPPRPEPIRKTNMSVHLADTPYPGAVPAEYGDVDLASLKPTRISTVPFRTARAISPPLPVYPDAAIKRGLSGACEVRFSITPKGAPFDVRASCSDQIFERAAEKSVKKVKFVPKIHNGLPVTAKGVVYPLEFRMKP